VTLPTYVQPDVEHRFEWADRGHHNDFNR
jgi:hypothetical protein